MIPRGLKVVIIFLFFIWLAISIVVGDKFDEVCVEGQISAEQAEVINNLEWKRCPTYRNGTCVAEAGDRVLVGQCSEFFKFVWRPDKWGRAIRTGKFPWQY